MKSGYLKIGMGISAVVAGFVLLDALFLEKHFFEIKCFNIGKKNSKKRIQILLLTDLHFVKHFHIFHQRLATKINALKPDLILIAGDTIDQDGEPGPALKFFSMVDRVIPKLAILGNHDHVNKVSIDVLKSIFESNNGYLLVNETEQLEIKGETFTVTGLDDFIEGESCLADAVRNVGREENHLLLIHSPLQQVSALKDLEIINRERADNRKVDIQYIFAGHNHGGQVKFGNLVPVLPEGSGNYINGWYNKEKPYLYLSRGFGTSVARARFGARAEITLLSYGV